MATAVATTQWEAAGGWGDKEVSHGNEVLKCCRPSLWGEGEQEGERERNGGRRGGGKVEGRGRVVRERDTEKSVCEREREAKEVCREGVVDLLQQ